MPRNSKNDTKPPGGEGEKSENIKTIVDVLKDIPPALVATPPIFFFLMWQLGRRLKNPFLTTSGWGCMLLSITESEVAEGALLALMGADLGINLSGLNKEKATSVFKEYFDYAIKLSKLAHPAETLLYDEIKRLVDSLQ